MKKKLLLQPALITFIVVAFFVVTGMKPSGMSHPTSLWIGGHSDTATVTPGDNDLYIEGTAEIGTTNGLTVWNTRSFELDLVNAWVNAKGRVSAVTTPYMDHDGADSLPAIVYAASTAVTSIGYTFGVPVEYSSALSFRIMVSSDSPSSVGMSLDWGLFSNRSNTAFDAVPWAQTSGAITTSAINPSTTNAFITLTADATALAGIAAGDVVTVWFWNSDNRAGTGAGCAQGCDKTTEIKSIQVRYTGSR